MQLSLVVLYPLRISFIVVDCDISPNSYIYQSGGSASHSSDMWPTDLESSFLKSSSRINLLPHHYVRLSLKLAALTTRHI
jgi:hypothetical protein